MKGQVQRSKVFRPLQKAGKLRVATRVKASNPPIAEVSPRAFSNSTVANHKSVPYPACSIYIYILIYSLALELGGSYVTVQLARKLMSARRGLRMLNRI